MNFISALRDERSRVARLEQRGQLLQASLRVFSELGYARATIGDITREARIRSTAFYDHFPDKESAFMALVAGSAIPLLEDLEALRFKSHDFEELVESLCRAYFSYLARSPVIPSLMKRDSERIRSIFDQAMVRDSLDELEEDIDRVVSDSGLTEVDSSYLAGTIVGVTFEVGIRMVSRQPYDVEGAVRFATAVIVGGFIRLSSGGVTGGC